MYLLDTDFTTDNVGRNFRGGGFGMDLTSTTSSAPEETTSADQCA